MYCHYSYANLRGTEPTGWRGEFNNTPQIRKEHRFMAQAGDRGIRFHDARGNLLFRTYYRPHNERGSW